MGGWDQVRSRLNGMAENKPMLVVFDTAVNLIRTLPALQHDTDKPEDLDTHSEDHAGDALRYACMSRPWANEQKPKPKPFKGWESLTLDQLWEDHDRRNRSDML